MYNTDSFLICCKALLGSKNLLIDKGQVMVPTFHANNSVPIREKSVRIRAKYTSSKHVRDVIITW